MTSRSTDWLRISLILCTFGFFREMRPSEPFVTEFLSGEWRNITSVQVNREIYPLGTYSYLAQLVVVFLITDILRYKPIIVLSACVGIILWSLLLWTYTLLGLQLVQVCYGFFMAAEVAYYTYIYAKVSRSKYQQVTGHTRSAILSGRFLGSVLAQILVSYNLMDLRELNFISLASQMVSLILAIMLPSVGTSLYFFTAAGSEDNAESTESTDNIATKSVEELQVKVRFSARSALKLLWMHFTTSYTNPTVVQWSIWWSLAMCGFLQVQSYVQLLWKDIDPNQENFYNGGVEAAVTLLGAMGAFLAGLFNSSRYRRWDLWILSVCSAVEAGFLLLSALSNSIWVAYVMYVTFGTLYHFMITIASSTVAENIQDDSFGLIFGINTLLALLFQSIFTVVVVSDSGLALSPSEQFITLGGYFAVLSVLYTVAAIVFYVIKWRKNVETANL